MPYPGAQVLRDFLSFLPPTLTSFTASGALTTPLMSNLPRSLTLFNVDAKLDFRLEHEVSDFAHMPSGMVVKHVELAISERDGLMTLPQSILSLEVNEDVPPLDLVVLPRSLTKLFLTNVIDKSWTEHASSSLVWPPYLTSLTIRCVNDDPTLIALLPRQLKHLRLMLTGHGGIIVLHANQLPPHLEVLNLTSYKSMHIEGKLPSSLRRFTNYPDLYDPSAASAALPTSLQSADIRIYITTSRDVRARGKG